MMRSLALLTLTLLLAAVGVPAVAQNPEESPPLDLKQQEEELLKEALKKKEKPAPSTKPAPKAEPGSQPEPAPQPEPPPQPEPGTEPQPTPAPANDPLAAPKATLEEVAKKMKQVRQRMEDQQLGDERTGQQTQQLQQEVIAELDKLIELAQQQQSQPSEQPQPNPNQQPNPEENSQAQPQPMPGSETQPMPEAQPQEQTGDPGQGPRKENDDAAESTENIEQSQHQLEQRLEAQRQERMNQVWGHLPERVRARILNLSREKSLPQYENLNERYYRALSEQEKEKP